MRIVLDTNILVSGLLQALGPSGQIVRWVAADEPVLCYDPRILAEYREVLRRKKFSFDLERVEALMAQIRASGVLLVGRSLAVRLPDLDDEPFLEIALAGGASYLVTGNLKHYPVEARQGIEVLAPGAFIELYRDLVK